MQANALRVASGGDAVDHAVLQVAGQLAQPLLLLVVQLVGDGDLPRGQLRAGDLHGRGEDLRVVAPPGSAGKARGLGVVALQGRVAEDAQRLVVRQVLGRGAAVAADHRQRVGGDAGDEHDLARAIGLDLVAHAEPRAVVHDEGGVDTGIGVGRVVDRVGVGQKRVLEPLVDGGRRFASRIAEVVEQRRLVRADDAEDVADVLGDLGQRGAGGIRGFTGERHGENSKGVIGEYVGKNVF